MRHRAHQSARRPVLPASTDLTRPKPAAGRAFDRHPLHLGREYELERRGTSWRPRVCVRPPSSSGPPLRPRRAAVRITAFFYGVWRRAGALR